MSLKDVRVRAPLWARERISSALRSIVCKLLTISVYRPLYLRSRAHGRLHVTPPLNPLPRGGDSAAKAAVRLLAQSLRSESASIQGQYNTKWALTPTPQRHHYLRYSSPCHLLFFKALYLRGVTKRVTARGILIRASCQFRLYKCLIPKRFLSP